MLHTVREVIDTIDPIPAATQDAARDLFQKAKPRIGAKPYPAELRDRAVQRVIEQGWPVAAAARMIGAPRDRVQKWVAEHRKKLGLAPGRETRAHFSGQTREIATYLVLQKGKTVVFAAQVVGASPAAVYSWIRKARTVQTPDNRQSNVREEAVRMVLEDALSKREVARVLGHRQVEVSEWVRQARAEHHARPDQGQAGN